MSQVSGVRKACAQGYFTHLKAEEARELVRICPLESFPKNPPRRVPVLPIYRPREGLVAHEKG
jgi:hypothetical protein